MSRTAMPAASRVRTQKGTGRAMVASPRNFSRWASMASCRNNCRGICATDCRSPAVFRVEIVGAFPVLREEGGAIDALEARDEDAAEEVARHRRKLSEPQERLDAGDDLRRRSTRPAMAPAPIELHREGGEAHGSQRVAHALHIEDRRRSGLVGTLAAVGQNRI